MCYSQKPSAELQTHSMVYAQHIRPGDHVPSVSIFTSISYIKWMGDSPTLISMIKCNLEHVVDNVDPKAKFEGTLLPYSPFTQAKKSFFSLMQA